MAKAYELSESGRVAIKHLSLLTRLLTRLSYVEIGWQIGYSISTTFKVFKTLELASSVEKWRKCGYPKTCWRKESDPSAELLDAYEESRVWIIWAISRAQG